MIRRETRFVYSATRGHAVPIEVWRIVKVAARALCDARRPSSRTTKKLGLWPAKECA